MATYWSGKQGKVSASGVDMEVNGWTVTATSERLDTTNALGNGYAEGISGIKSAAITANIVVNTDNMINGSPGLIEGAAITCNFYIGTSGKFFTCTAFIDSIGWTSAVRGSPVMANVTASSTGTYTLPVA